MPKLDLLSTELFDFDILSFSETWLNPSVSLNDLHIQSFNKPERKDRVGNSHGGVLVYVKDNIHYRRRHDLEILGLENIWIELIFKHKRVLFGLFYRPPNSDQLYYNSLEDSIHLAIDTGIDDVIITGDLNFNMSNPQSARKIQSLSEQFSLHQCISEPTHFTEHSSSLIDILLLTKPNHLILSGVGDPFLQQDVRYHCPIYGIFKFAKPKQKSYTRHIWKYEQGDYVTLKHLANTFDWTSLKHEDINIYSTNITEKILEISKLCIPNKIIRIRPSEPTWMNSSIKKLIRKRKRTFRKAKRSQSPAHWAKFKQIRNDVVTAIRQSKKSLLDNLANKLKYNTLTSRDWWTSLKSFISPDNKSSIPPLDQDGTIYSEDFDKANILNDFFCKQTMLNDENVSLPELPLFDGVVLSNIVVTCDEVESVLKALPIGKATGPDGINNCILRELAHELSPPLCSLFNQSLILGIVPDIWKEAHVCPIPKGGDRTAVSNYRPISLLSNINKVLERIVFKHLYNHFLENDILTPLQSGFIPGDSTVNQLLFLYNAFCKALDAGKEVRVIFCDISKAFDRVWHAGLIHKLRAAGISGNLLDWFTNYLFKRRQRVVLPGVESLWTFIKAGVPQGSILGPLLFLLFINDIVNEIHANIQLFADDTSLYLIVEHPDVTAQLLNIDLETIAKWAKLWLVTFNPSKSESLLISRKVNVPIHPPIFMHNQQLTEVTSHKHLGLHISKDCTWHEQIENIKEKAWFRINIMRKFKCLLDRKSLETIYFSFIRPILEYTDVVWDNCTQQEKQDIEKIQIEAARIVTGTTKLVSINSLYEETGWETLETRRKNHKLTLFFKMINGLSPQYLSDLVPATIDSSSNYNLRNSNNIHLVNARTALYYNSFLPSVVRDWNNIPDDRRNVDSVIAFKNVLSRDKPIVPKHYLFGNRKEQILHTRLRTNCSALNYDLYMKNIIDSPLCRCNNIETVKHFFLDCPNYNNQRITLMQTVSRFCAITLCCSRSIKSTHDGC